MFNGMSGFSFSWNGSKPTTGTNPAQGSGFWNNINTTVDKLKQPWNLNSTFKVGSSGYLLVLLLLVGLWFIFGMQSRKLRRSRRRRRSYGF